MRVSQILLLPLCAFALDVDVTSSLTFDVEGAKNRPVTKVIALLKDMTKQLEKDAEEDEAIYDKMACWCETNDKEKSKTVADTESHMEDLNTKIEQLTASSARLQTETANLKQEIQQDQEALDEATAIRKKQLAEFTAEEKDLLESIGALKAAIHVLSKHHTDAMLQGEATATTMRGVASTLRQQLKRHPDLLKGVLTHKERRHLDMFVQSPDDYFRSPAVSSLETSALVDQNQPQSGEIYGVLRQMKETFEQNLADVQKEETSNQAAYKDLKSAKQAEITAGQEQLNAKEQELADSDDGLAQAKEDLEDTTDTNTASKDFLVMLKAQCTANDQQYELRTKERQRELQAVSEAQSELSSDDAHDLFTRTFNPSFLQESESDDRQKKAAEMLAAAAKVHPRLTSMATRVRNGVFGEIQKAINQMVAQLLVEKQDEIKHKDYCVDELNKNQLKADNKEKLRTDLNAKIEELESNVKQLEAAIASNQADIKELGVQVKEAGAERAKQNKEFQATVADQRETQKLLAAARKILSKVYEKAEANAGDALLQKKKGTTLLQKKQEPPQGFDTYTQNEAAPGVLSLLDQIINDAKAMETDTIREEKDSQKEYEALIQSSNESAEAANNDIVNKSKEKAKAEQDLVESKAEEASTVLTLEQLENHKNDLHESCDFVLNNFDNRQAARDEEVEALKQAKAILSGAKFGL